MRLKLLKSGVVAVPAESPLTSVGEVDMVIGVRKLKYRRLTLRLNMKGYQEEKRARIRSDDMQEKLNVKVGKVIKKDVTQRETSGIYQISFSGKSVAARWTRR